MYDIIAIGSATLDVFVNTGNNMFRPCKGCKEHVKVPFGSKLLIKDLKFFTGGGGTNTAVGFSRMGLRTAWIGKIGNDKTGQTVLEELKAEKVSTALAKIAHGQNSGYSIILDAKGHDRTVLAFKGVNDQLKESDIDLKNLKTKWIYCSSQLGESLNTLRKTVSYAHKKGILVAFNPSTYMITNKRRAVMWIVKKTYILVFNLAEARLLAGSGKISDLLIKIQKMGPRIVVITDGKNGAWAAEGHQVWHTKAPNVNVVEATGAGDSFATGFVTATMNGMGLQEAMQVGMVESASVISHLGAKNILLTWPQTLKAIRKLPKNSCRRIQ